VDRRFLRPGWIAGHLLVFAAVLTCLRLGWWQWQRTQETTGTAQNFGYAVLWPAFGAAFVYMWVRFLHLEVLKDAEDGEETDRDIKALLDEHARADRDDSPIDGVLPAGVGPTGSSGPPPVPDGSTVDGESGSADQGDDPADEPAKPARSRRGRGLQRPNQAVTISVAMVGEDDDDDPELTAYNQALAALAEEDRRRAR
jgi:hypothetical protein